jgi:NodT family efflux transporter outer membrane factor (OMF) lipoprotein
MLLAACLSGCSVGPNFVRPNAPVPAHYPSDASQRGTRAEEPPVLVRIPGIAALPDEQIPSLSATSEATAELSRWWSQFHDTQLDALIAQALGANLNLRVAIVRTQEALAQRDIQAAALWPALSANASYDLERISESTPQGALFNSADKLTLPGVGRVNIPNPYNQYQLAASLNWEFDLFGRVRRSIEAASAAAQVSLEDQRAVQVSLLAQVAQSYLALRGAQARRAVALQNIATIQDLLQLTQQRHAAGLNTELDLRNALAQLSQTHATLPALDLQINQSLHALAALLGREPEALRAQLQRAAPLPPLPPHVPIGLPADLVRRRPDVREAEANLHAATAQIGVAVGNLFPRLTLTAAGGFQSDTVGSLLRWSSLFANVGPTLQIPVFDRGAWRTVKLYRLRQQEAALAYQAAVLTALQQVDDALAAYDADQRQRQYLSDTVAQNREALAIARERYTSGVTDFINVLDALRTLQQNQMSLLASSTAASADLVLLYRALGGGWVAAGAAGAAGADSG